MGRGRKMRGIRKELALTYVFLVHYTDAAFRPRQFRPPHRGLETTGQDMTIYGHKGGSMRALSGASLAVAMLWRCRRRSAVRSSAQLQAMKAFKAANQAYQQQDYKKAAGLYEEAINGQPQPNAGLLLPSQQLRSAVQAEPKRRGGQRRAPDEGRGLLSAGG